MEGLRVLAGPRELAAAARRHLRPATYAALVAAWTLLVAGLVWRCWQHPLEPDRTWVLVGMMALLGGVAVFLLVIWTLVLPARAFWRTFWVLPLIVGITATSCLMSDAGFSSFNIMKLVCEAYASILEQVGQPEAAARMLRVPYVDPVLAGCTLGAGTMLLMVCARLPAGTRPLTRARCYAGGVAALLLLRFLAPAVVLLAWPEPDDLTDALDLGAYWVLPPVIIAADLGGLLGAREASNPAGNASTAAGSIAS